MDNFNLNCAPKNVLILGDSYSTFEGCIPEGYGIYYYKNGREDNDVTSVSETWWHLLAEELNLNIVHNNSWSGSTICYTGYGNTDRSRSTSFIYRLNQLEENGFFLENKIDTVFIFGGTNDSWANSPLGEETFDDYSHENLFNVLPAVSYIIKRAKEILPEANVILIVNDGLKPEIAKAAISASKKYGASYVLLENVDKSKGHPTVKGMQEIKEQILKLIKPL